MNDERRRLVARKARRLQRALGHGELHPGHHPGCSDCEEVRAALDDLHETLARSDRDE